MANIIKTMLLCFVVLQWLSGCSGDKNTPSREVLVAELEKNLDGITKVGTLKLERTGQVGNRNHFNVAGDFRAEYDLYQRVANFPGERTLTEENKYENPRITVVHLAAKKGTKYPFSAMLQADGHADTGWQLKFSNFVMPNEISYLFAEESIRDTIMRQMDRGDFMPSDRLLAENRINNDPRYVKTNSREFAAFIKKQEELSAGNQEKAAAYKAKQAEIPAMRDAANGKMKALQDTQNNDIKKIEEAFNAWQEQHQAVKGNDYLRKRYRELEEEYRAERQKLERGKLVEEIKSLQGSYRDVFSGNKQVLKEDGTAWTLDEISEASSNLKRQYDEEKMRLANEYETQKKAVFAEYDEPLQERKKQAEAKIREIEDKYGKEINEIRDSFRKVEEDARSEEHRIQEFDRDEKLSQHGMEVLREKGFLK